MPLDGEYIPSTWDFVADQVRDYEASDGREANTLDGKPIVVLTTVGRKSGALRKAALMRIERDGKYVVVASMGGAPKHPVWYLNLVENPRVTLQDGATVIEANARTLSSDERIDWWPTMVEAWPPFDEYQAKTDREIPVVIIEPIS